MSDLLATCTHTSELQVTTEDQDAAPAIEVQTCGKGRAASCLYVDQASQLLWVADKEGWVYGEHAGLRNVCCACCGVCQGA